MISSRRAVTYFPHFVCDLLDLVADYVPHRISDERDDAAELQA
jgi:hypothetical protein